MSLVFAGITPHPPILLPSIGKDASEQLAETRQALEQMEQDLYAAKPDTLIVISPHGVVLLDTFLINLCNQYEADLSEFGDFTTKAQWKPNLRFVEDFRSSVHDELPLTVTSEQKLDHGAAIPLLCLTSHLPKVTIVPLSYSLLSYHTHLTFGELLKEQIMRTNERVAVIASGDLSHRLSVDAPAGFSPRAEQFDRSVVEFIQNRETDKLLALDPALIEEVSECGLRSICILLGVLRESNYQPKILAYEHPFGVGHLTAEFLLK